MRWVTWIWSKSDVIFFNKNITFSNFLGMFKIYYINVILFISIASPILFSGPATELNCRIYFPRVRGRVRGSGRWLTQAIKNQKILKVFLPLPFVFHVGICILEFKQNGRWVLLKNNLRTFYCVHYFALHYPIHPPHRPCSMALRSGARFGLQCAHLRGAFSTAAAEFPRPHHSELAFATALFSRKKLVQK